jgi:hypothetical protein
MYTLLKPAAANRIQMKKRQTDLMAWARAVYQIHQEILIPRPDR